MMSSQTMLSTPPHGVKRRGDDSVDPEQRLSKRFNLLNLEHNGKLWSPAQPIKPIPASSPGSDQAQLQSTPDTSESMQMDDTKDRLFIHNLDEELATLDDGSGGERLVFLPDIERKLAEIPNYFLRGQSRPAQTPGTAMILYKVPASLTIPVEQDSVRKAIIESRARAREQQQVQLQQQFSMDSMLHDNVDDQSKTAMEQGAAQDRMDQDEDAMDIG